MRRLSLIGLILFCVFHIHAQSPHGKGFKMDCAKCHDPGSWTYSSKAKFKHDSLGFPLKGQHKSINCNSCHQKLEFNKKSTNCVSCHSDIHKQSVGSDCARCHTSESWIVSNITRLHEQTSFPLIGVHKSVDCNLCHKSENNLRFDPMGQTCKDCHMKDYQTSKNPDHSKLQLTVDCAVCHSTMVKDWKTTIFPDHETIYPLTGAHASIARDCEKCHTGGNYSTTPRDCFGCHSTDFNKSINPNHTKLNLSTNCESCHTTAPGWAPASFPVHDMIYPLTGAHKPIEKNCAECHKSGSYSNTPNTCNACHNADYNKTNNPNHTTLNISTDCASCHTTNPGWMPAKYDAHNDFFPLLGGHSSKSCNQCHKSGNYNNTPNDCNSCHNADYLKALDPNHISMGFSTDCASCHSTNPGWAPATFTRHNEFYPLTGAHKTVTCNECHKGGNFSNTPNTCNACHNNAFQTAKNPNHISAGFPTDCASCHTTNQGWRPSTFDHNSYYPLTGAHKTIALNCTQCHKGGDFKNTPKDCNSCHNNDYQSAKNPNHATAGFPTDCVSCHTTNPGWRPSSFNHTQYYSLTGAHKLINCNQCHTGGIFKNTPTDCYSCHTSDFKAATNPNHIAASFSTDCKTCHSTNPGWAPTTFNHDKFYILLGAHKKVASNCTQCHVANNYKNTPTTCVGCHNLDYKNAIPNHQSAGFNTECASCHSQNVWKPANWNHDANYFPIYSGKHRGVWTNCTECHTTSNNYGVYNCLNCHQKSETDNNHRGVSSYSYNSTSCFSCHPKGQSD